MMDIFIYQYFCQHVSYLLKHRGQIGVDFDNSMQWYWNISYRAMVVAQLEEWLLPTPEVWGSNPVVSKFYSLSTVPIKNDEEKKIETGNASI